MSFAAMAVTAVVVTAMVGRIGSGLALALLRLPRLVNGSEVLHRFCDDLGFAASAAEATSNDHLGGFAHGSERSSQNDG